MPFSNAAFWPAAFCACATPTAPMSWARLIVGVVLDTNTLVSGMISPGGPPRRLLDGVRAQAVQQIRT